ncbi:ADP-ribosylglycohydrolase family protein [Methanoplanus endosymbiosus]|uniref:ADP-ribosylglycohydrolase family protein n=1 Tax=Methanoplanus endosymbiosus TaxID=33865 RepID=A0A9E7PMN9_9EURY|nr:ADP-ribosylglycohydrolase family protein [Methanoplanus endosymbiosus]UUX91476.1 ADP-ribosylglycohydrolase family protein [Methanoplanus endosymbiosus]
MENEYRGAMLGAAMGDALGMPYETTPTSLRHLRTEYARPSHIHPNSRLKEGCYTDDTQIALAVSELFISGNYSVKSYSERLKELHLQKELRFPDGTILSACRHIVSGDKNPGCFSDTAGCVPLGLPFALAYTNTAEIKEKLAEACSVTHSSPVAYAGTLWFALLLRYTLSHEREPLYRATGEISDIDEKLAMKIDLAIKYAEEGISAESALQTIGNNVSIYQTVPLSAYLILRYGEDINFLNIASQTGGNTDTIAFICGAWAGAEFGASGLPEDLLIDLENRERIENIAKRLFYKFSSTDQSGQTLK